LGFHPVSVEMPLPFGPLQLGQSAANVIPERIKTSTRVIDNPVNVKAFLFIIPPFFSLFLQ